jgi:hypothetical protein
MLNLFIAVIVNLPVQTMHDEDLRKSMTPSKLSGS